MSKPSTESNAWMMGAVLALLIGVLFLVTDYQSYRRHRETITAIKAIQPTTQPAVKP